jgi:hypothetical protein
MAEKQLLKNIVIVGRKQYYNGWKTVVEVLKNIVIVGRKQYCNGWKTVVEEHYNSR